jgi:hypothetical protein
MSLRSTSASRLARRIAIRLAFVGLPALVIGLGCTDEYQHYPALENGPSILKTIDASSGGDAGDGGAVDLCGCAVSLRGSACTVCNEAVIVSGMACGAEQTVCAGSAACTADAQCIGACTADGGVLDAGALDAGYADGGALDAGPYDAGPLEPGCVSACLQKATSQYIDYLTCACTQCAASCSTPGITCP